MNIKLLFVCFVFLLSCDYYFDNKALTRVEGKKFNVISLNVVSRDTFVKQELVSGSVNTMIFNECDSKDDLPCRATLIINEEKSTFIYDLSTEGLFFQSWRETLSLPDELPPIVVTGNWLINREKKKIELRGTLGFKDNFPAIHGTHDAIFILEEM